MVFSEARAAVLMHVIKALSDCSFPAELEVSLKAGAFQVPPAFTAINNPADGDKGWEYGELR